MAKLAPDSLKLEIVTLHKLRFFNQDLEVNPPAVRRRGIRHSGIQLLDSRRAEERHRHCLAPLCAEFIQRAASRDYLQFDRPAGRVSAAKHLQQILPGISGPIMQQPETYLSGVGDAFDDKGELIKESLGHPQGLRDSVRGLGRGAQEISKGAHSVRLLGFS